MDVQGLEIIYLATRHASETFSWFVTGVEETSYDIRDRQYIPIDILVSWKHPYIINYTRITGTPTTPERYPYDVSICFNDLWDSITLVSSEPDILYIGSYFID